MVYTSIVGLALLSVIYLATVYMSRKQQLACLLSALVVVLPGTHWTRQLWNERMGRAEREARFYLANPDKLLLSEEEEHYINLTESSCAAGLTLLTRDPSLPRLR